MCEKYISGFGAVKTNASFVTRILETRRWWRDMLILRTSTRGNIWAGQSNHPSWSSHARFVPESASQELFWQSTKSCTKKRCLASFATRKSCHQQLISTITTRTVKTKSTWTRILRKLIWDICAQSAPKCLSRKTSWSSIKPAHMKAPAMSFWKLRVVWKRKGSLRQKSTSASFVMDSLRCSHSS